MMVSGDWGGWALRGLFFEADEAAVCSCCARYTLVEVKALRASECLPDLRALSCLLERRGSEDSRIGFVGSGGRWRGLPLRGRAVVKETANVLDVLDICKHHEAL